VNRENYNSQRRRHDLQTENERLRKLDVAIDIVFTKSASSS
jgi:hypothetical protein